MKRSIAGIPLWGWAAAIGAVIAGVVVVRGRQSKAAAGGSSTTPGAPTPFSQAQEIQDFSIFQALTSQQQSQDLGFVSQMLQFFGAGGGTGTASAANAQAPAQPATASTGGSANAASPAPPTGGQQVPISPLNPGVTTTVQTPTPPVAGQPSDYAQVPTIAQEVTDLATGVPVYWESAPGVFNRVSVEHPAPLGAAIYVQGPT